MFNTIIITVKTLLRRPSTWVWGALFPIALSTMFMFMFANLSSDGTVDPVPVAVIADEAWDASTFKDVATSLAKESDDQLLEIHECDDAADANRALKAGEVAGIYTVDDAGVPKLTLLSSYDSSRASSVLTDRSILETVASSYTQNAELMSDFDPNHLTAPADMEALDRWAITKLNELLVRCEAAYKDYEFLTVSHAVNDFCVVTLSSLYLDIIKDRLYCDGKDSASRRSAQSALWMILDAMTKVFAPILAFTCDEIWLQMPHRTEDDPRNVVLNQMTKPYADYALSEAEMTAWETAFRLRSDVNGVLETARADKRIGKSLEAHVALFAKDEDTKAALEAVKAIDLPEIFIVSNVSTDEAAPAEGAVVEAGVSYPGLTVAVSEAKGTKCPRCWMHSETPDEHGLCPRCAAVCKALNVVFE